MGVCRSDPTLVHDPTPDSPFTEPPSKTSGSSLVPSTSSTVLGGGPGREVSGASVVGSWASGGCGGGRLPAEWSVPIWTGRQIMTDHFGR